MAWTESSAATTDRTLQKASSVNTLPADWEPKQTINCAGKGWWAHDSQWTQSEFPGMAPPTQVLLLLLLFISFAEQQRSSSDGSPLGQVMRWVFEGQLQAETSALLLVTCKHESGCNGSSLAGGARAPSAFCSPWVFEVSISRLLFLTVPHCHLQSSMPGDGAATLQLCGCRGLSVRPQRQAAQLTRMHCWVFTEASNPKETKYSVVGFFFIPPKFLCAHKCRITPFSLCVHAVETTSMQNS